MVTPVSPLQKKIGVAESPWRDPLWDDGISTSDFPDDPSMLMEHGEPTKKSTKNGGEFHGDLPWNKIHPSL